jgi:thioredoxin reductase (NADPH)
VGKPAIISVDDDPQVLSAVGRDLRSRYAEDFRIVGASSGDEALQTLVELQARGDTIALFLVDQRMPEMSGTEFLIEARKLYPDAKRVLLTAYADTEAAIQAINDVELDHYLMKPWDPPEDNLYPVVDDLIDDWQATVVPAFDGIRVAGTTWSPASHDAKDFLARNQVPYRFLDIERDPEAARMVAAVGEGSSKLPVVFFPGGEVLVEPDRRALADAVGMRTEADRPFYDLIIVGGGPAGLAGAVYGASEGLRVVLIEREATGGQAGTSSRIENYLGFPKGVSGADLARRATAQATRLGAEIVTATEVTRVEVNDPVKVVKLADGKELQCHALLIASGMTVRKLSVPGYEQFHGAGVYYGAAASEALTYQDREVYVIGGANSAGQGAMMFARFASTVHLVVRAETLELRMSQYLVEQIRSEDNIDIHVNTEVVAVEGTQSVESITIRDLESGDETTRSASALFIFVGAVPHSKFVDDLVLTNDRGFILTGPDVTAADPRDSKWMLERDPYLLETNVPGIFAAGDVRHGAVRRVASAVGQGSVAISFVHQYLESV